MTGGLVSRLPKNPLVQLIREIAGLSWLTGEGWTGGRGRTAALGATAVSLSVLVACALHLPEVWWAAISGFMSTQPTRPGSIHKAFLRIIGTSLGAASAYLCAGWLAYDHVACCLVLFLIGSLGIYGVSASPHGYAWLFFGITFGLVTMMSLTDPTQAFDLAVNRTLEVIAGTGVALLVANVLAPDGPSPAPAGTLGWRDTFGRNWPAVLHAVRGGIAIGVIPLLWSVFYLPELWPMAMTVAAVMAIPVLSDHPATGETIVARSIYRLLGCCVGGILGLWLIAMPLTDLTPWLAALWAGIWFLGWLQTSPSGAGYVGTQATIVFMMTLVQGFGPPDSIMPGIDRFAGITLGLATLLVVAAAFSALQKPDGLR